MKRSAHALSTIKTLGRRLRIFTEHHIRTGMCFLIVCVIAAGCASVPKQERVLAVVDGEPVTENDLRYSLQIAHRKEDLSTARNLDISGYIDKLIEERLIIQEARRMGIDRDAGIQDKVDDYVLRESVMKLYDDEILQKVSVTEQDIVDYYKKNYERFSLNIIEVDSEDMAGEILQRLNDGEDFVELARRHSTHSSAESGGAVDMMGKSLGAHMKDVVADLRPDEISDVVTHADKYYIIRLTDRREAPNDDLKDMKDDIRSKLKSIKINERSDEYLKELRKKKKPVINRELLASLEPDKSREEREKLLDDRRPLVTLDDTVLTVGEFVSMLTPVNVSHKENVLNAWLDRKLVDKEALSREYEKRTDLGGMARRYRNELLKKTFIKRVLVPRIRISEEEMQDFYESHIDDFVKPLRYRVQQITVQTREDARNILDSLRRGADFSWLARTRSTDSYASRGGSVGWVTKEGLHENIKEIVDTMAPGEISSVLEIDSLYRIMRVVERSGKETMEFSEVQDIVKRRLFRQKYKELYSQYIDELKKDARITINEEAVREYEKVFDN